MNRTNVTFREFELENGLKVVLSKNTKIPFIAQNITFKVGSKNDFKGKSGIAHLLEHLMFDGYKGKFGQSFDDILTLYGGDNNAFTNWDLTGYYIQVPSQNIESAMWLDSIRFSQLLFSEDDLKMQKSVVLEENLQVHENVPYGTVEKESSVRLFRDNGYHLPVIGLTEEIQKISYDDIRKFSETFYTAGNAVVSFVGDFSYSKIEKLIRKYFSEFKYNQKPSQYHFSDSDFNASVEQIENDSSLPAVFFFYKMPPKTNPEFYYGLMLSYILSSGDSSELNRKLINEKNLANYIEVYICELEYLSLFIISVVANEDVSVENIIEEVDEILRNIKELPDSKAKLEKVKNKIETEQIMKLQSNCTVAEKLCEYKLLFDDCNKINMELNEISDVTWDNILYFLDKFINKKRLILKYK
jgi:zinc protease